jgi:hypothetical protein
MKAPVLVLCLLLAALGIAGAQEMAPPAAATDKAAYALMQDTLLEAEKWILEMFIQPGSNIPIVVLREMERLDDAMQESYFRDLAQRSGMLLFLTREQVRRQEQRFRAAELSANLSREFSADRRQARRRRTTATLFWASLGTALVSFAGSYGCWYTAERLDQRYLTTSSPEQAALFKAWSKVFSVASYAGAGIGAVSVTLALPALAGMRAR